jgi:hypothetical protein
MNSSDSTKSSKDTTGAIESVLGSTTTNEREEGRSAARAQRQCPNTEPHAPHAWDFIRYCPGVPDAASKFREPSKDEQAALAVRGKTGAESPRTTPDGSRERSAATGLRASFRAWRLERVGLRLTDAEYYLERWGFANRPSDDAREKKLIAKLRAKVERLGGDPDDYAW